MNDPQQIELSSSTTSLYNNSAYNNKHEDKTLVAQQALASSALASSALAQQALASLTDTSSSSHIVNTTPPSSKKPSPHAMHAATHATHNVSPTNAVNTSTANIAAAALLQQHDNQIRRQSVATIKLSQNLRTFLEKKLLKSQRKIKTLKRKRIIMKTLIISSACASILISVVLSGTATLGLGTIIVAVLTMMSGILTGVSLTFNFKNKKYKLEKELDTLFKLESTLDYVVSCNGDLTKEDYDKIMKDIKGYKISV